jgi:hypothetical protein
MSTERDAGLQALQQGNPAAAVPLLETACHQNPGDFDAYLYLGAAYGQLGRQMDAINTITRAVQLQPANAQARYNLAVAMEQGGYREQAVQALGQALQLQPEYPKAREALRRLQGAGAPPAPAQQPAAGGYGAPAAESAGQPPSNAYAPAPATASGAADQAADAGAERASGMSDPGADENAGAYAPTLGFAAGSQQTTGAGDAVPYGQVQPPAQGADQPPSDPPFPPIGFGQVSDASVAPAAPAYPPSGAGQPGGYSPQPAQPEPLFGAPPPAYGQNSAPPPPYGAPPAAAPTQPLFGAPPSACPVYGQPGAAGPYAPSPGPYGGPPTAPYAAPPAPYGAPPPAGPYAAPPAQGVYARPGQYSQRSERALNYEDRFDIVQAAKDWGRILVQPAAFFRDMTGTAGFLAPAALALLYLVPILLGAFLPSSQMATAFRTMPGGMGSAMAGVGTLFGMMIAIPILVVCMFIAAWILHLIGLLFNNRSPYSASFRALVFAYAPMPLFGLLSSAIPSEPLSPNPFASVVLLLGFIWYTVLLVMSVSSEQEVSPGAGFAIVLLSYIAGAIVIVGVSIVLGIVVAIAVGAAAAGPH